MRVGKFVGISVLALLGVLLFHLHSTGPVLPQMVGLKRLEHICPGDALNKEVPWKALNSYAAQLQTGAATVGGWLADCQLFIVKELTALQLSNCMLGSVGEIGVHHGKFFIGIALASHPSEPMVAMDLFGEQEKNTDRSGRGNKNTFLANCKTFNVDTKRLRMLEGDSRKLTVRNFTSLALPQFRMLSVDGAHYYDATLSDLRLASKITMPGGVIIVDDFIAMGWIGVMDSTLDFLKESNYAPFLWVCNKLYLTTKDHHATYLEHVSKLKHLKCTFNVKAGMHPSRYTIRGHKVCITTFRCTSSGKPTR